MRAIWSGSVSFGLVNIPVRIYSASGENKLEFDLLHEKDLSRIRYAKVCQVEEEEVPSEEIVKGYEYEDGQYVIMTDEDFKKADARLTRAIEIKDFVYEDEIDPMYFEKPYYLKPDKGAAKAYALLREALRESGKVAIARFVLRSREHLAVIKPVGDVLVLEQIRYAADIRNPSGLKLPKEADLDQREMDLALQLVGQLTEPFKPEQYRDEYREELREIIEEKASGKVPAQRGAPPQPTEVVDLMAMLKKSLEEVGEKAA